MNIIIRGKNTPELIKNLVKNNVTPLEKIKATVESIKYSNPYIDYFSNKLRHLKDWIGDLKLNIISMIKTIKSNEDLLKTQRLELISSERIKPLMEKLIDDERMRLKNIYTPKLVGDNEDQKPNHTYPSEDYKK